MAKKYIEKADNVKKSAPALTTEAREQQLISLAVDLAEEQLRNGTASSQVITHYLKLATVKEKLELEKLEKENKLLIAKTEMIQSARQTEELYKNAIEAFTSYKGSSSDKDY